MRKEDIKLKDCYKLFIDGQWVESSDGATLESVCPADGSVLAKFADASEQDVDKAVKAARSPDA